MFVGHYGVSFAIKRASPTTSLGTLFLAVQLLDVLFSVFLLVGLEKLRVVPGFTQYNPYDLYYMPYTHSLAGAAAWAMVATGLAFAAGAKAGAPWIGADVFSHFLLAGITGIGRWRPSSPRSASGGGSGTGPRRRSGAEPRCTPSPLTRSRAISASPDSRPGSIAENQARNRIVATR